MQRTFQYVLGRLHLSTVDDAFEYKQKFFPRLAVASGTGFCEWHPKAKTAMWQWFLLWSFLFCYCWYTLSNITFYQSIDRWRGVFLNQRYRLFNHHALAVICFIPLLVMISLTSMSNIIILTNTLLCSILLVLLTPHIHIDTLCWNSEYYF